MNPHPLPLHRAQALGPAAAAAVEAFRRPSLPTGVRYALLLHEANGDSRRNLAKPRAFESLAELARGLHRRRGAEGLQLVDSELRVAGEIPPRSGVSVWALDPDTQAARRFLGWAWLGGAGRHTLQAALAAECPPEVDHG